MNDSRRSVFLSALIFAAWFWGIWSCAEHWRGNPNYSYGWIVPALVLAFAVRRLVLTESFNSSRRFRAVPLWLIIMFVLIAGPVFFALEFAREQVLHPLIVIWIIAFFPVAVTLAVCWFAGGNKFLNAEAFPILFFLTSVPWPPRFEQPITSALMQTVAATTTSLLHLLGIEAQTSGGAITLRNGVVGITEACSGIRSLQSGIMFGLAVGEWFLLRPLARLGLLLMAVTLALGTNLIRTLVLSIQAEWHGVAAVDNIHDLTGTIVVTVMVAAIWLCGRLLRGRAATTASFEWGKLTNRWRDAGNALSDSFTHIAAGLLLAGVGGITAARLISAKIEMQDHTQTAPFFSVRDQSPVAQTRVQLPRDVWNELHPTSGEAIRIRDPRVGYGESYHFFWKPSPWNRFVLVHRPDVCMPGVGWQSAGGPELLTVDFAGHEVQLYAFRFRRGEIEALELWGVWRNGDSVPLDYQPDQVLRAAAAPPALHLEGKRRSATEIVSCVIAGSTSRPPESARAVAILRSVFQYQRNDS